MGVKCYQQGHTRCGATLSLCCCSVCRPPRKCTLASYPPGQYPPPSSAEIFYDPEFAPIDPSTGKKNTKKTPPMLGTQPRNWIDTKFTYNYTAWGAITLEYSYGSLPPAFNKTDHSVTFGLTFAVQEGGFGRISILRPTGGK